MYNPPAVILRVFWIWPLSHSSYPILYISPKVHRGIGQEVSPEYSVALSCCKKSSSPSLCDFGVGLMDTPECIPMQKKKKMGHREMSGS